MLAQGHNLTLLTLLDEAQELGHQQHPRPEKPGQSAKGPSRTVFSKESDSVVFYYSVVTLLRTVTRTQNALAMEIIVFYYSHRVLLSVWLPCCFGNW